VIAGNRGTDLLGQAMETWFQHLVDSGNNARPVKGRDGLGWGTPMSPEFRQVLKTVAFGWSPPGSRQLNTDRLNMARRLGGGFDKNMLRSEAERYFTRHPELRSYQAMTPVARVEVVRVEACRVCTGARGENLRSCAPWLAKCTSCGREL
jgi:hypothetical protein